MEKIKKFQFKKIFLCVLCSIILTTSLGITILFIDNAPLYISTNMLSLLDKGSEDFKEILEKYDRINIPDILSSKKELYGEDYPTDKLLTFYLISSMLFYDSHNIVETYSLSFVIGLFLGLTIYVIVIQKTKGKALLFKLLAILSITLLLMLLINLAYQLLMNSLINEKPDLFTVDKFDGYIYDFANPQLLLIISFVSIPIVAYVFNILKEKKLACKSNHIENDE